MFDFIFGVAKTFAEEKAVQQAAEQPSTIAALVSTLLPMVLIMGVFYFLMIRPQRKKDKQVKDMLANLKVGDRICTIGGIYGTISSIKDETVTLKVGKDNLEMVVTRWAIRSVEEQKIENEGELIA